MNDIYEVTRDEYTGFIGQLNKEMMDIEQIYQEDKTCILIKSKATQRMLCQRIIHEGSDDEYFIYNMPENNERIAPKPVMKVTLESKEEVQAFFNALNKIQLEAKKNGC